MKKILSFLTVIIASSFSFAQITVSATSGTATGSYTTLKDAFDAINIGTHRGNIGIRIHNNTTESATCSLNNSGNASGANYTSILIRPADTATVVKTITFNIGGSTLISLNGADNVIVDGRPLSNGSLKLLSFVHTQNLANSHTIEFINSSESNILRYVTVQNGGIGTTTSSGIRLRTGTNNNNLFQNCTLDGGNLGFEVNGTNGTPNVNTTISNCLFTNQKSTAIRLAAGVGDMTIDSNLVTHNIATTTSGYQFMNVTEIEPSATVNVLKNRVFNLNTSAANFIHAIFLSPSVASGTLIARNNSFVLGSDTYPNSLSQAIRGILFTGTLQSTLIVEHNTIRVGGTHSTANGNPTSFCVLKTNTNTSSSFTLRNNLLINTRTGTASSHVGLSITSTNGTNTIDYNTYYGSGVFQALWGSTSYSDIDLYKAAASPNEQNSSFGFVDFLNTVDPSLNPSNSNNTAVNLLGAPIGITTDYFGNLRSTTAPFRGAHESTLYVASSSITTTGTLNAFTSCSGIVSTEQSFTVSATGLTTDLIVTAPTGYEVSAASGTGFSSSVTLTHSSGSVATTTIYVRLA